MGNGWYRIFYPHDGVYGLIVNSVCDTLQKSENYDTIIKIDEEHIPRRAWISCSAKKILAWNCHVGRNACQHKKI